MKAAGGQTAIEPQNGVQMYQTGHSSQSTCRGKAITELYVDDVGLCPVYANALSKMRQIGVPFAANLHTPAIRGIRS